MVRWQVKNITYNGTADRASRKDGKIHWETWNGSGWADEDWVISQVTKEQQRVAQHGS